MAHAKKRSRPNLGVSPTYAQLPFLVSYSKRYLQNIDFYVYAGAPHSDPFGAGLILQQFGYCIFYANKSEQSALQYHYLAG